MLIALFLSHIFFYLNSCTQENQRWLYPSRGLESCIAGRQAPIRIKDKQYYKKLLDRYFGQNHVLSNENNSRSDNHSGHFKGTHAHCGPSQQHAGLVCNTKEDLNRNYPHIKLSYSNADKKVLLTHEPYVPEVESDTEELYELEVGTGMLSDWLTKVLEIKTYPECNCIYCCDSE